MVAARLARQQILDSDRAFHFVLTEGVLRWHVGSPQIMIGQAEHLATLVELPNVRLASSRGRAQRTARSCTPSRSTTSGP